MKTTTTMASTDIPTVIHIGHKTNQDQSPDDDESHPLSQQEANLTTSDLSNLKQFVQSVKSNPSLIVTQCHLKELRSSVKETALELTPLSERKVLKELLDSSCSEGGKGFPKLPIS